MHLQQPKRNIIEHFIKLLCYEGQWDYPFICRICHQEITGKVSLTKGLKSFHPQCNEGNIIMNSIDLEGLALFNNSFSLNDEIVDRLFHIIM